MRPALERARSRLPTQIKINNPIGAYVVCGFVATAIVALLGCGFVLASTTIQVARYFDLMIFIVSGTFTWLAISVAGILVAWPFVAAATWIGRRLQLESFGYYFAAGGLTMAVLVFAVFGLPQLPGPDGMDIGTGAWAIGPACGASWGGCWWSIHRRWTIRRSTDPGIFA